jgi:hypothetical protein
MLSLGLTDLLTLSMSWKEVFGGGPAALRELGNAVRNFLLRVPRIAKGDSGEGPPELGAPLRPGLFSEI